MMTKNRRFDTLGRSSHQEGGLHVLSRQRTHHDAPMPADSAEVPPYSRTGPGSGLPQGDYLTLLGRCLVCLPFLLVYRCWARYGSGQGSAADILNQASVDGGRRYGSFSRRTIRLVLQWLARLIAASAGLSRTLVNNAARGSLTPNQEYFLSSYSLA